MSTTAMFAVIRCRTVTHITILISITIRITAGIMAGITMVGARTAAAIFNPQFRPGAERVRTEPFPPKIPPSAVVAIAAGDFGTTVKPLKTTPAYLANAVITKKVEQLTDPVLPAYSAVTKKIGRDIAAERPKMDMIAAETKVGAAPRKSDAPLDKELRTTRTLGGREPLVIMNTGGVKMSNNGSSNTGDTGSPRKPGAVTRQPRTSPPIRQSPIYTPPANTDPPTRQSQPKSEPDPTRQPPVREPPRSEPPVRQPPVRQEPPRSEPPTRRPPRSEPAPSRQPPAKREPSKSDPPKAPDNGSKKGG